MGKFDGILLATDLDGTLLDNDKQVSKENADAIRYFQSEGGLFTVATGRHPDFLQNYTDSFKINGYAIALNGNIIYDINDKKLLYVSKIKRTALEDLLGYITRNYKDDIRFVHIHDESESYCYEGILKGDACKCVIVGKEALSILDMKAKLTAKYGNLYNIVRSWDTGLEIYDVNSGKGKCIEYIKNMNPAILKTIAVGDYENDISMLEIADIGYAVKNAVPDALRAADRITDVDNEHNAIAWVIKDLEKEGI